MISYKRINTASTGGGGGGSGSVYEQTFTSGDWVSGGGYYSISILETTHDNGLNPLIQVQELVGSNYRDVIVDAFIDNVTGTVTIQINQTPDLRFTGRVLILGGA